jgi:hypothetical protein
MGDVGDVLSVGKWRIHHDGVERAEGTVALQEVSLITMQT